MWRLLLLIGMLIAPTVAWADAAAVVVSAGPSDVGVTIYRDPQRGDQPINKDEPGSFALISETRVVDLPPGPVTIRFEGVAGGIVPQSAILFGTDPRERNRDAALLSQGGLVDAFTGQQVIVRRMNPATGQVSEERATIRSSADRLVISTSQGAEAVYCTGLAQTLIYPNAPATLSAKPVLSMTTRDQPGGRVSITLAYLATGFDWDATYVATLARDGKSLALLSWLTMVSADQTSFIDATTSAVAGQVNRSDETRDDTARAVQEQAESLDVFSQCWPSDTTSDIPLQIPLPKSAPVSFKMAGGEFETVIVTGTRRSAMLQSAPVAVTAVAENVGDLILYRIPVPVTVAARSQKQVAFLADKTVRGELIYRVRLWPSDDISEVRKLFRFTNTARNGLGQPLPAGGVVLYQEGDTGRALIGEAQIVNKTTNEEVDVVFGEAENVTIEPVAPFSQTRPGYIVRNAGPTPIRFELEFYDGGVPRFFDLPSSVIQKPSKKVWSVMVPANGERTIRFGLLPFASQR
jgi:hypothetical protein